MGPNCGRNRVRRALRLLSILYEHTQERPILRADRAWRSQNVLALPLQAMEQPTVPEDLRSEKG